MKKEVGTFFCDDCKKETSNAEKCAGKATSICGICFDKRVIRSGSVGACVDSLCWGQEKISLHK